MIYERSLIFIPLNFDKAFDVFQPHQRLLTYALFLV